MAKWIKKHGVRWLYLYGILSVLHTGLLWAATGGQIGTATGGQVGTASGGETGVPPSVQGSPATAGAPLQGTSPPPVLPSSLTPEQTQKAMEVLQKQPSPSDPTSDPTKEAKKETQEVPQETKQQEGLASISPGMPSEGQFGMDFFAPARKRILALENQIISGQVTLPGLQQKDALSGFVGPLEMVTSSVYAAIPQRYVLSPGDTVTLVFWGKILELQKVSLVVEKTGEVTLPKVGKIVVQGMTLDQFQNAAKLALRRVTETELEVIATLDQLRSLQIFMTGEAFRPGSYAVSAVTTLFNALHASGGPSDKGSLRDIRLIRNQQTIRVDFYDYLLRGESHNDIPLQAGDTIFIAPIQRSVKVRGEVNRPATYELQATEDIATLIQLAENIKASGMLQRLFVHTLSPNKERVVTEVSFVDGRPAPTLPLYDGDTVDVQPVLPVIKNLVTLEGSVERPGTYELKEGYRVADLFSEINKPLAETYIERADIIRLNEDFKTTTLIPIHLGKALAGDPAHNLLLASLDRVIVYSQFEVAFYPKRVVSISGMVQKPGEYTRSDDMTIKDLLVMAGGTLADAYMERMDMIRFNKDFKTTTLIPIHLGKALAGDPAHNLLLASLDRVIVYSQFEVAFYPKRVVSLFGAVQKPGEYLRSDGMTIRDLLVMGGGVLPGHVELLELARARSDVTIKTFTLDIQKIYQNDPKENILLDDEDIVMVRKRSSFFDRPLAVTINGEVAYPGTYVLKTRHERLADMIKKAGGPTQDAYLKGAVYTRRKDLFSSEQQRNDLALVNSVINTINELDFSRQVARNQFLTMKEGIKQGQSTSTGVFADRGSVTGASPEKAAAFAVAPSVAIAAGETVEKAIETTEAIPSVVSHARQFTEDQLQPTERMVVNIARALSHPNGPDNIMMKENDTITLSTEPTVVNIAGAVMRPTAVVYHKKMDVEDYIHLSGGYAEDANQDKVMVLRVDGSIQPLEEVDDIEKGDIIYVPPKVVGLTIVERMDKITEMVKFFLTTAASVAVFLNLIKLF